MLKAGCGPGSKICGLLPNYNVSCTKLSCTGTTPVHVRVTYMVYSSGTTGDERMGGPEDKATKPNAIHVLA